MPEGDENPWVRRSRRKAATGFSICPSRQHEGFAENGSEPSAQAESAPYPHPSFIGVVFCFGDLREGGFEQGGRKPKAFGRKQKFTFQLNALCDFIEKTKESMI